jgi:HEAT repeat protein
MLPPSRQASVALLALTSSLILLVLAPGGYEPPFEVEITTADGRALPPTGSFAFAGIEQTLVARVDPPVEGVELKWSVGPRAIRTYEHDVQDASKHKVIPLTEQDRKGPKVSFFWTEPRDGAEVAVTATSRAETVSARVVFDVRLPRDANRLIYSFADNDPRRSPNGVSASYATTRDHRHWHLGLRMSNGALPAYATLEDAGGRLVWGDLGYRTDPARLFDLDYNGSALVGWHGRALDAHRAWRRTFHVPPLDAATPAGSLPVPGYLRRVPEARSADTSRLYGYVRVGEFQNLDQLGRDLVHPWHNRSHTGIAKANAETLMDNHGKSPPAKNDLFWRWHSVVEEVRRAYGPDQATVTEVYPGNGATVGGVSAVYLAFDRKVSFNAPAANKAQLLPALLKVNGKPATTVEDIGGESSPFVTFRLTGFPVPAEGPVKVELGGTTGVKGGSWTCTVKQGAGGAEVPVGFRQQTEHAFVTAQARHRKEDIERLLAKLKPDDADELWVGYLFRAYPLPPAEGVPILVGLLDHPSDQVKGRAIQTLQNLYPRATAAAAAAPKLAKLLHDPGREWWVREWAALALGLVGEPGEAVRQLVASLVKRPADQPVNVGSLEALGRLGPKAAEALPTVRKYLADRHPQVQRTAYQAVGQIVNAPAPAVADLKQLEVVDWNDDDGGYAVHRALQKQGEQGAFAVPALLETYRRKPPVYAQAAVIETLGHVGGGAPAVKVLLAALPARWGGPGDPLEDNFLSDRAAEALARMPTSDAGGVPLLAEALGHANPVVRVQAARTLHRFGPGAKPAVGALVKAVRAADGKTDPYEVGAYLGAIRAVGPGAGGAAPELAGLLDVRSQLYRGLDPFWAHYTRAYILVTLADIGVPDEAKPHILDLLNNSDVKTSHGYAAAARAVRRDMPEAVAGLQRALKPDFADFPMSWDDFARALGNEDSSCRLEALRALARIGPRAKAALPVITPLVSGKPDPASPVPPWNEEARKAAEAVRGRK